MIPWQTPPDTGNPALNKFLTDIVEELRTLNRQAIAALPSVTLSANATYGANEQAMLAQLKTLANGIKENI